MTQLHKFSNIAYDKTRKDHEDKLMQLWKNLKPEKQLGERMTENWIDIGFQAKDPSTDFRGAGLLGFELLFGITGGKHKESDQVFHYCEQVK